MNSNGNVVRFSPGNLQYKNGEGWRFAEHQYDYIGAWDISNWVDLFGWGTWGEGSYWSSTTDDGEETWRVWFSNTYASPVYNSYCNYGHSVRLVR